MLQQPRNVLSETSCEMQMFCNKTDSFCKLIKAERPLVWLRTMLKITGSLQQRGSYANIICSLLRRNLQYKVKRFRINGCKTWMHHSKFLNDNYKSRHIGNHIKYIVCSLWRRRTHGEFTT